MDEGKRFCQPPAWDVEAGKRMYDEGARWTEIGQALGIRATTVRSYALRHWINQKPQKEQSPPMPEPPARKPPEREKRPVLHPVTGLPMMGPCTAECEDCEYIFRSGGLPICDYYLQTGEHRYPNEDGSCAVKKKADGDRYAYARRKEQERQRRQELRERRLREDPDYAERIKRKPTWDVEKGLELWLKGYTYRKIADAVGAKEGAVKSLAHSQWRHLREQRDAAVEALGGVLGAERVGAKPGVNSATWDREMAQQLWLQGKSYSDIGEAVNTSTNNVKNYANRKWTHLREQRNAAVAAAGGVHKKHR